MSGVLQRRLDNEGLARLPRPGGVFSFLVVFDKLETRNLEIPGSR
jgi:hypothetical protein